jgi:mitogen-activated protein kinase kinase kinase ANP1
VEFSPSLPPKLTQIIFLSSQAEVALMRKLEHPNIVRYLGTSRDDEMLNIFMEYVPGGSISSLISRFGKFSETVVRVYTKQILAGLVYLHEHQIIHRDVKGANILVDNAGRVKLADFGASMEAILSNSSNGDRALRSMKGTPFYMAPEGILFFSCVGLHIARVFFLGAPADVCFQSFAVKGTANPPIYGQWAPRFSRC